MKRTLWMAAGIAALVLACGGSSPTPDEEPTSSSSSLLPFAVSAGALGAECVTSDDCNAGFCDRTVPGGMCTSECDDDSACGSGRCYEGYCFVRCTAPIECRSSEFACFEIADGQGICGFDTTSLQVSAPNVGAPCRADIECMAPAGLETFCIPEVDERGRQSGYPGGMCVALGCSSDDACGPGATCYAEGAMAYCVPSCDASMPCRDGLACVDGMCGPE